MTGRTIFREAAIEAYQRGANKDIVPRLTSRLIIVCSWLLLAALGAAALLAWSVQVPAYVGASGVLLGRGAGLRPVKEGTAAVLFLPPNQAAHLRASQPVHGQIGSGTYVQGAITKVEPGVIGPDAARDRYRFAGGPDVITQPSTVVIVRLADTLPPAAYGGSRLTAQVEIGSQRLLALIPGLGKLLGGD